MARRPALAASAAHASGAAHAARAQFYYHFRKAQQLNPCTEMSGFTRLLASSNGMADDLVDYMPTVSVAQLGFDKTRGFQAILVSPSLAFPRLPSPSLTFYCPRLPGDQPAMDDAQIPQDEGVG